MIAMTPVLERGFTFWDRSIFPHDEFEERTGQVQALLAEAGLDALLVWSQSYHTSGDLAYLAGWPMGGALLLMRDGDPIKLNQGGGRELYFQKMQTWLADVRAAPGSMSGQAAEILRDKGLTGGRIGIVGIDLLSPAAVAVMHRHLSDFTLVDFSGRYHALRAVKRSREVLAISASLAIASKAVAAGEAIHEAGGSNVEALLEAERTARIEGARDFRALANLAGHALAPFERQGNERQDKLLLWVAVDQQGYWAEAGNAAAAGSTAKAAVDAMRAAARGGATAGAVADAGLAALPEAVRDTALSYGLGGAIGLDLDEAPRLVPGNDEQLVAGAVLSLRVCLPDEGELATATIRVDASGGTQVDPL